MFNSNGGSFVPVQTVDKGGSWFSDADLLRVGLVFNSYPDARCGYYGFRPARTAQ
jgi:formylglycine-generating enzyme required for sulfatase activity